MKISNKQILIILISVVVIFSVYAYLTRATSIQNVTGYIVLLEQKVSSVDYQMLGVRNFESLIYLPSGNGEGSCTACSFTFPAGVNEKADVTKDGKIDYEDLRLAGKAFGCGSGQAACWNQNFGESCFFTLSGRLFEDPYPDPNRDCKINDSDISFEQSCFGQIVDTSKDSGCARADMNKDGVVDGMDLAIVARLLGTYADTYKSYSNIQKKDLDLTGDGAVDGSDLIIMARYYGKAATEQTCQNVPLTFVGTNVWKVTLPPLRGLNYVACSYKVSV